MENEMKINELNNIISRFKAAGFAPMSDHMRLELMEAEKGQKNGLLVQALNLERTMRDFQLEEGVGWDFTGIVMDVAEFRQRYEPIVKRIEDEQSWRKTQE